MDSALHACAQSQRVPRSPSCAFPAAGIKQVNQNNAAAEPGKTRYRLAVSDGEHWMSALIATQMAHLVTENRLVVNTVLRLKEYIVQDLGGRKCAPASSSQSRDLHLHC